MEKTGRMSYCSEVKMHSISYLKAMSDAVLKVNPRVYFALVGVIQQQEQRQ